MSKKHIPVTFNGELVGRADSIGDGRIEMTILYQPLIDIINHDSFRDLEIGYSAVLETPSLTKLIMESIPSFVVNHPESVIKPYNTKE